MEYGSRDHPLLILGIGNVLMGDDGFGVAAADYIKKNYFIPPGVEVIDGGTGGLSLLRYFKEFDTVIIIDAVKPVKSSVPGRVLRISKERLSSFVGAESLHDFGVNELLTIASFEGHSPEVVVIGSEPLDTSPGCFLSPLIRLRIAVVGEMVREELKRFGLDMRRKNREEGV